MHQTYIGIGTNLGDRVGHLRFAVSELSRQVGRVSQVSSVYRTEPISDIEQDDYLNAVVHVETTFEPEKLLTVLHKIEVMAGRERAVVNSARTLDLDLLLYDDEHIMTEELKVPHERMTERAFVLAPLYELAPQLQVRGQNIHELLKGVSHQRVELTDINLEE